jgi:hypothetical protein
LGVPFKCRCVQSLERFDLILGKGTLDLPSERLRQQAAAHSDAPVNSPHRE